MDASLTREREDWQVLLALAARGDVDGFITNDTRLLLLPREMIALSRTRLALVVTEGVGHQPLRATGLVMVHLEQITRLLHDQPRIFRLHPGQLQPTPAWNQINVIADHLDLNVHQLVEEELASMGLSRRERSPD